MDCSNLPPGVSSADENINSKEEDESFALEFKPTGYAIYCRAARKCIGVIERTDDDWVSFEGFGGSLMDATDLRKIAEKMDSID